LEGKTLKGKALTTEYIKVLQSEFRDRFQDKKNKGKKAKMEQEDENDTRTPAEKLADQITPLWR
jgi:tRNA (uracil-5-)-methyltransferase